MAAVQYLLKLGCQTPQHPCHFLLAVCFRQVIAAGPSSIESRYAVVCICVAVTHTRKHTLYPFRDGAQSCPFEILRYYLKPLEEGRHCCKLLLLLYRRIRWLGCAFCFLS
ncbi:hypothetical protein BYT27DRAFT_6462896 [Phlegmacium glaucopus]|nr:hypothetical protein BYT27DRAFT_6462896 [Phlegmacium glaucopus]